MGRSGRSLARDRLKVEGYLNLIRINRELDSRAAALLEEEGFDDITMQQASALMVLVQERKPTTAARLSEQLNLSAVTVGRFVHSLDRNGWIRRQRDPNDSRAILLSVTRKTTSALPRFLNVTNRLLDEAYRGFTAAEIKALVAALGKVRGNLFEAAE